MNIFSSVTGVLGYETLSAGIARKSFYDLSARLPGKDKILDFVSHEPTYLNSTPHLHLSRGVAESGTDLMSGT